MNIMREGVILAAREVIGDYLSKMRNEKNISKCQIAENTGLRIEIINDIESGTSSYTIDSLLKYTTGIGAYLFFGDKTNKKNQNDPLDEADILDQCIKNDPLNK